MKEAISVLEGDPTNKKHSLDSAEKGVDLQYKADPLFGAECKNDLVLYKWQLELLMDTPFCG